MNRSMLVLLMIAGLVLAGCEVDTQPKDVGNFSTNRAAIEGTAEYDGTYTLYGDNDATVNGPVLMSAKVKAGEMLGFEIDQSHVPYAVAGQRRLQLPAGRYRWEMKPDAGQTDWKATNVLVIEVVVASVVVVLALVSTLLAVKQL